MFRYSTSANLFSCQYPNVVAFYFFVQKYVRIFVDVCWFHWRIWWATWWRMNRRNMVWYANWSIFMVILKGDLKRAQQFFILSIVSLPKLSVSSDEQRFEKFNLKRAVSEPMKWLVDSILDSQCTHSRVESKVRPGFFWSGFEQISDFFDLSVFTGHRRHIFKLFWAETWIFWGYRAGILVCLIQCCQIVWT